MENFMWKVGNTLAEMRIIIEGAVRLYEEGILPFYYKEKEQGEIANAVMVDTISEALHSLKDAICELQTPCLTRSKK